MFGKVDHKNDDEDNVSNVDTGGEGCRRDARRRWSDIDTDGINFM